MKRSKIRKLYAVLFGAAVAALAGSTAGLVVKPMSVRVRPGTEAKVSITLEVQGESKPAGLNWKLRVPERLSILSVDPGPIVTAAGKTLTCKVELHTATCLAYGLNRTTLDAGVLAVAHTKVLAETNSLPGQLEIVDVAAAGLDGRRVPASGGTSSVESETSEH